MEKKYYLSESDFLSLMKKGILNYTLVRPHEIRQRFTEFAMANPSLAYSESVNSNLFR